MTLKLNELTIHKAHDLLVKRKVSSLELTQAALERIHQVEDKLGAFLTITEEQALEQARRADQLLARGEAQMLTGIPMAIKDVICTRGIRTTCGSRMLESFVPPYNATVIVRLNAQNPVLLGKLNMDEFAMGSSNENSAFFPVHNPWDLDRVPGGSSGGSAVAVAAGEALFSLGSDTGGSIRLPASFCGVVGLKPTYGLVSRYGLVAFASSLDQIGPFTRDVADCALITQIIGGHDPHDSTSIPQPTPDYARSLVPDLRGMRLGVPRELFGEGIQAGVKSVLLEAIGRLQELGAEVSWDVSLPSTKYALPAYYILNPSEAMANLARYDGVKYGFSVRDAADMWDALEKTRESGFGPEVKRRIMLGTYALSAGYYDAYYLKAQRVRTLVMREFNSAFDSFDALISPVAPMVPFKLGEKVGDPLQMYLTDICTVSVNIAGIPGLSVPAGFVDGLPVGMQIMGKPLSEATLFRIGYAFQQVTDWHKRTPNL